MKRLVLIFFILTSTLLIVRGQTYTYNPTKSGCNSGSWTNTSCWDKVNNTGPSGCVNTASPTPPFSPTATGSNVPCDVNVIINHNTTLDISVTFGGGFNKITVTNGTKLTISKNTFIASGEQLILEAINGGKIEVLGQFNIGMASVLNIIGDGTGMVSASSIDYDNDGVINVELGGFVYIIGETKLSGKDVLLNIRGLYRTGNLTIAGNNATLDVNDTGILLVEEDFKLQGQGVVEIK